jgi:plastocyanin
MHAVASGEDSWSKSGDADRAGRLMSPPVKSLVRLGALLIAASALGLTACADDGPIPPGMVAADPVAGAIDPRVEVLSIDNTFSPAVVEVAPGTEVVWVNRGRNDHDIVSDDGWGVAAADFAPGDSYGLVFTEPGVHRYHCTIHGTSTHGMVGTVIVTDD